MSLPTNRKPGDIIQAVDVNQIAESVNDVLGNSQQVRSILGSEMFTDKYTVVATNRVMGPEPTSSADYVAERMTVSLAADGWLEGVVTEEQTVKWQIRLRMSSSGGRGIPIQEGEKLSYSAEVDGTVPLVFMRLTYTNDTGGAVGGSEDFPSFTPDGSRRTFTALQNPPAGATRAAITIGNDGLAQVGETIRIRRLMATENAETPYGIDTFSYEVVNEATIEGSVASHLTSLKQEIDSIQTSPSSSGITTYHPIPATLNHEPLADTPGFYPQVMETGDNYGRLWNMNSANLAYSDDDEATWNTIHNFGDAIHGVLPLSNGELIVTTWGNGFPGKAWVSSGLSSGSPTWTQVLETTVADVYIHRDWGMSQWENYVLLSEYGLRAPTDGAHRLYLSQDYGQTFEVVFNLRDYLGISDASGLHVHGSAIDPYHITRHGPRLWACHGDVSERILWSDDLGKSWAEWNDVTQMVGIMPMPAGVLFTSDSPPNGIYRSRRTNGILPERPEVAWLADNDGYLTVLGGRHQYPARTGEPALLPFSSSDPSGQKAKLVMTVDGESFHKVWEDDRALAGGRGLLAVFGPLPTGQYGAVLTSDGRVSTTYGRMRFDAPDWVAD